MTGFYMVLASAYNVVFMFPFQVAMKVLFPDMEFLLFDNLSIPQSRWEG